MLTRRLLLASPFAVVATHYGLLHAKAYAREHDANPPPGASYRALFAEQDKLDQQLVDDKRRAVVSKAFGYPAVVQQLDKEIISELDWVHAMYSKPLSPERRIRLRKLLLPYLERATGETKDFFEGVLRYYDVL